MDVRRINRLLVGDITALRTTTSDESQPWRNANNDPDNRDRGARSDEARQMNYTDGGQTDNRYQQQQQHLRGPSSTYARRQPKYPAPRPQPNAARAEPSAEAHTMQSTGVVANLASEAPEKLQSVRPPKSHQEETSTVRTAALSLAAEKVPAPSCQRKFCYTYHSYFDPKLFLNFMQSNNFFMTTLQPTVTQLL